MKIVDFKESNIVFGRDQPEYLPLPAHRNKEGIVTSCWKLDWWERFRVLWTGKVWLQLMTFNQPPQPQKMGVKVEMVEER